VLNRFNRAELAGPAKDGTENSWREDVKGGRHLFYDYRTERYFQCGADGTILIVLLEQVLKILQNLTRSYLQLRVSGASDGLAHTITFLGPATGVLGQSARQDISRVDLARGSRWPARINTFTAVTRLGRRPSAPACKKGTQSTLSTSSTKAVAQGTARNRTRGLLFYHSVRYGL